MTRQTRRQTRSLALRTLASTLGVVVALGWVGTALADQAQHEGHEPAAQHDSHSGAAAEPTPQEPAATDHSAHQAEPVDHDHGDQHAGHGDHVTGPVDEATTIVRGGVTREEEKAYSLFMHRSCGLALIGLGVLILADRMTQKRYGAIRKGMGAIWFLMGIHIFLNADPTDWPLAASFAESWARPGSGEWLQHKVLSLIPVAIGLNALIFARRRMELKPSQSFALGVIMALGGIGLMIHQHEHSPGMDMALIEKQHRTMAVTSLLIALGAVGDGLQLLTWKAKPFVLPIGLILLGLELAVYVE
ncbi:MAG: hypothetical protein ACKOCD_08900 [Nitrospiraceae bacterium]